MFAERFARDGCLVVDRLFDRNLIDRVRDEFERQYSDIDPVNPPLHLKVGNGRLQVAPLLRGALLDPALYAHPVLLQLLKGILADAFVIDSVSVVLAMPGASDQRLHRDHPPLFGSDTTSDASLPGYAVTVAIPLIDLDAETGSTELFPGSIDRPQPEHDTSQLGPGVVPFVQRGGCFLMDYRLWHRGRANRTSRTRPILYIVYAREWFTDMINFARNPRLAIDPVEAARIPNEHRPMFRRAGGNGIFSATMREPAGSATRSA